MTRIAGSGPGRIGRAALHIVRDPRSSIVDLGMTRAVDADFVKVMAWYDNERGDTAQMVRGAVRLSGVLSG